MITRKMFAQSAKRKESMEKKFNSVGEFMGQVGDISDSPVKAEFDTWSWYYGELSNIRTECSRLGLLVRLNNGESGKYVQPYYSHIYSYLQLVLTVLSYDLAEKIRAKWRTVGAEVEGYFQDKELMGRDYKIPDDLIYKLDLLYDVALKIGQEIGLGFRASVGQNTQNALERSMLGE